MPHFRNKTPRASPLERQVRRVTRIIAAVADGAFLPIGAVAGPGWATTVTFAGIVACQIGPAFPVSADHASLRSMPLLVRGADELYRAVRRRDRSRRPGSFGPADIGPAAKG